MAKSSDADLLRQVRQALDNFKNGNPDAVDLASISAADPALAESLAEIKEILKTTVSHSCIDTFDLSIVTRHLAHISETGETGVLNVLNIAETIMADAGNLNGILDELRRINDGNDEALGKLGEVTETLDTVQNNCFSILTSLEFDDINQQLMKKIITRLSEQNDHLMDILLLLKSEVCIDRKDSEFLKGLKHIIDLDDQTLQSQDMIDEMFDDFDSF